MEILRAIFTWFILLHNNNYEKEEDAEFVIDHLAQRLSYEWLFSDQMMIRCKDDQIVKNYFAKYPDDQRELFFAFVFYAAIKAGEIEAIPLTKEFSEEFEFIISKLPMEVQHFYRTTRSAKDLVGKDTSVILDEDSDGPTLNGLVIADEETREKLAKMFLRWETLHFDPNNVNSSREYAHRFINSFIAGEDIYRFRKKLERTGKSDGQQDKEPQFELFPSPVVNPT